MEALDAATRELSRIFSNVFLEAGIEGLHFHDLRHEATCRLYEKTSLSDVLIAKITGHKDLRICSATRACAAATSSSICGSQEPGGGGGNAGSAGNGLRRLFGETGVSTALAGVADGLFLLASVSFDIWLFILIDESGFPRSSEHHKSRPRPTPAVPPDRSKRSAPGSASCCRWPVAECGGCTALNSSDRSFPIRLRWRIGSVAAVR